MYERNAFYFLFFFTPRHKVATPFELADADSSTADGDSSVRLSTISTHAHELTICVLCRSDPPLISFVLGAMPCEK